MQNKHIGFIGCGKMASAIIQGLIKNKFIKSSYISETQTNSLTLEEKSKQLGIKIGLDNQELVKNSDVIILAVKPSQVLDILAEINSYITNDKLVISIAAGVTLNTLEKQLPQNTRVIRVMPNTPALIGEGMSGIVLGKFARKDDEEYVKSLFATIGKYVVVNKEAQIDIVTAISGSGPAFFYKIINDIAKAGEKLGLDYEKSLLLSIQTAIGSAKMALNREKSMEELISNVATKGGCTRVGVDSMEEFDTEKIFFEIIKKTTQKASELGK